ncbi:MAG: S-layer homology domain-containing protein [bacterium]
MKKKILFTLFAIFILASAASAQDEAKGFKFEDIPDNHWAASAVYDLIKMGVTKGYPDGTFRGDKPINRYETAIFLSKLAKVIEEGNANDPGLKQLRDQLNALKNKDKNNFKISGSFDGDWKMADFLGAGSHEVVAGYRLLVTANKEVAEDANLIINIDTMDYGYYDDGSALQPGRGQLATELFDVETNFKIENVDLKLTYGPGPKQHSADPTGVLPSEVGRTYMRPATGIWANTSLLGLDVQGGFRSLKGAFDPSGKVTTGWITGVVSKDFNRFKVDLTCDYISQGFFSTSDRNIKAKIDILASLTDKIQVGASAGLGRNPKDMMAGAKLSLNDLWDTGTVVTVNASKIGAEYINTAFAGEQYYLAGLDRFDRPYENSTVNIGGELVQNVSDKTKIIGRGDVRLTSDYKYQGQKARLTAEGGLTYNIAPDVNFDAAYRVHQDKGTGDISDLAAVGLIYRF